MAALWLRDLPGKFAGRAKHFFVTTLTSPCAPSATRTPATRACRTSCSRAAGRARPSPPARASTCSSSTLASPNVTDEKIGNLLSSVPNRSVILIEDADAFFQARTKADAQVRVSYSGFINALDGVAAHEGSVVFLTTNHPQLIGEAAIRSGRVDFRLELGPCDRDQLERLLKAGTPEQAVELFAQAPEGEVTMLRAA